MTVLQRHELESLKLGQKVRNSVQDAVAGLGGRVTVGDVAARAGVKINEAEEALNALAADAGGTLEVSTVLSYTTVTAAFCVWNGIPMPSYYLLCFALIMLSVFV